MKLKLYLIFFVTVFLISCNKNTYVSYTYPFMDWSNPDSIFNSYDTLRNKIPEKNQTLIRFWIDPSSTLRQFIEIKDSSNGYTARKVVYGLVFDKENNPKKTFNVYSLTPKRSWNSIIKLIDSLDFMNYKSRYHSWQTDGGPMHTPMIWYRIEYYKNNLSNNFVFWNFMSHEMDNEMRDYEKIVQLFENNFNTPLTQTIGKKKPD